MTAPSQQPGASSQQEPEVPPEEKQKDNTVSAAQQRLSQRMQGLALKKQQIMGEGGNSDAEGEGCVPRPGSRPSQGSQREAWGLGMQIQATLLKPFGIRFYKNDGRKLMVDNVQGADALACGIQPGDILEAVNRTDVTSHHPSAILKMIKELPSDTPVDMTFRRPGVSEAPSSGLTAGGSRRSVGHEFLGVGPAGAGLPGGMPGMGSIASQRFTAPQVAVEDFPEMSGWLEKKGNMFWNMRYFVLRDHVLSYYGEEVKDSQAPPVARGTINLKGARITSNGGVLKIDPAQQVSMAYIDRVRYGNSIRLWHRDKTSVASWYKILCKSVEVDSQRDLLQQAQQPRFQQQH